MKIKKIFYGMYEWIEVGLKNIWISTYGVSNSAVSKIVYYVDGNSPTCDVIFADNSKLTIFNPGQIFYEVEK